MGTTGGVRSGGSGGLGLPGGNPGTGGDTGGSASKSNGGSSGSPGGGMINATGGSGGRADSSGGTPATGGVDNRGGSAGLAATGGAGGGTTTGGTSGSGGGTITALPTTNPRPACTAPTNYRNLFGELLQKTDAEVEAKLAAAFEQMFHGGQNQNIYYETGTDEAYILDVNSNDVRSEGMSYGMLIALQLDKETEFKRLWKWTKAHMAQSNGYFSWQVNPNGNVISTASAPDGEEYFATALLFAAKRWGNGSDIYNYASEAQKVLDALTTQGNFNTNNKLVTFGNSGASATHTDPSYILPAFYEVWACHDSKNQQFWREAIAAGRAFFPKTVNPNTGLAPYLANFDGSNYNNSEFNSDSWRVVGNIMMDHNLFAADPWQTTFAAKYAAFFASAHPFADEFRITGEVTHQNDDGTSKGLVAQNALVAFGVPAADGTPFVQALWDLKIPEGQYRYYDGMLYMLALLHASGRFHLWF
jgi:oligosaccharide reducing-end xylanase